MRNAFKSNITRIDTLFLKTISLNSRISQTRELELLEIPPSSRLLLVAYKKQRSSNSRGEMAISSCHEAEIERKKRKICWKMKKHLKT